MNLIKSTSLILFLLISSNAFAQQVGNMDASAETCSHTLQIVGDIVYQCDEVTCNAVCSIQDPCSCSLNIAYMAGECLLSNNDAKTQEIYFSLNLLCTQSFNDILKNQYLNVGNILK